MWRCSPDPVNPFLLWASDPAAVWGAVSVLQTDKESLHCADDRLWEPVGSSMHRK